MPTPERAHERSSTVTPKPSTRVAPTRLLAGMSGLLACFTGALGHAEVVGTPPAQVGSWRLYGGTEATGAALLIPGPTRSDINSVLLPASSAEVVGLPDDAEVVAAYLFWSGSLPRAADRTTVLGADHDVDFTTADGSYYFDLSVDGDPTGFGRCATTPRLGGFYYCRRDVTDILRAQGIGNAKGFYSLGQVDADPGSLDTTDPEFANATEKYAAWSLLVLWQAASQTVRKDVVIYDGFLHLDETDTAPGIASLTLSGFAVGSPASGELTVFGLEGDRQLGVPPQDSSGCPTCYDYVAFQSASAATFTKLTSATNPPNNSFNASFFGEPGLDIDTYNLSGLLATGDNSAQVQLGSGDGLVPGGDGESFFVGWLALSVDALAPSFRGSQTRKVVSQATASDGQRLTYTIDVVNRGSLPATGVVLQDSVPAGTSYVPDSTRLDGVALADVGGSSPLALGLDLGSVPDVSRGDNSRRVTFAVRVDQSACGSTVSNTAQVNSNETEPLQIGPAETDIASASLSQPLKSVSFFLSPSRIGPGAPFTYAIGVENSGSNDVGGVRIVDPLPSSIVVSSYFATSGTVSLSGGALTVTDVQVPAGGTAQVWVNARVATVAELAALGISADSIDGLVVSNQATVEGGCNPAQPTDDPAVSGVQATAFSLFYRPDLQSSSKTAQDLNGGVLEPGDIIRYTITAINTGNRALGVVAQDNVPAGTTYVNGSTRVDGTPVADVGGSSPLSTGLSLGVLQYVGDNDRTVTFDVRVAATTPDGTVVTNTANLQVPAFPAANAAVVSPPQTVVAAPALDTSTKAVVDLTPPLGVFRPGDDVQYSINVTNSGNRSASLVVVQDTLPAGLTFVSLGPGGSFAGGVVSFTVNNLAAGGSRSFTFRARIDTPLDNGTVISNTASIDSAETQPYATPPAEIVVTSSPQLAVTKVDEHPSLPATPGSSVTYRILIRNDGDMVAHDVVVADTLDPALTAVAAPTGNVTATEVSWDGSSDVRLAAIAPGAANAVELVFSATLVTPIANGTVVANQASVQPAGFAAVLSDDPDLPGSSDVTTFAVVSQASLTVQKGVVDLTPATPFQPGEQVRYDLVLTAGGDAPCRDIVVGDPIDGSLANVDASGSGGSVAAGQLTFDAAGNPGLLRLDPGDSLTLSFVADIAPGTGDGTVVSNQATVQSGDLAAPVLSDGDNGTVGSQPTVFTVTSQPLLVASKTVALEGDNDPDFNPGDTVRYTLDVQNIGAAPATAVSVSDNLSPLLLLQDAGGASLSGSTLSWSSTEDGRLASLAPGTTVSLSFTATLANGIVDGTVVDNQANVSANGLASVLSDDPAQPGSADPTRLVVRTAPTLSLLKTVVNLDAADPTQARPGERLLYTLTLANVGSAPATGIVVRDPTGAALTQVQPQGAGRIAGGEVLWDATEVASLSALGPGQQVILKVQATVADVADSTPISNQAVATCNELLPTLSDADLSTPTSFEPTVVTVRYPVLSFTKDWSDLDGGDLLPQDRVRFTLTVANSGSIPARGVQIFDAVDPAMRVLDAGGAVVGSGSLLWSLGDVGSSASAQVSFEVEILANVVDGTEILNQGQLVEASGINLLSDWPETPAGPDPARLVVRAVPDLSGVTKEVVGGATTVSPKDVLTYRIRVPNTGVGTASAVEVRDQLDPALELLAVRGGGVVSGQEVSWALGPLAAGAAVEVEVDVRVRDGTAHGTVIDNQASVWSPELAAPALSDDPSTPAAADPTRVSVDAQPRLTLLSLAVEDTNGGAVLPGDRLQYVLRVANGGTADANDARASVPLPSYTHYIAGSTTLNGSPVADVAGVSPLASGLAITSAASREAGVLLRPDTGVDEVAEVRFFVRVDERALLGTEIGTQGEVEARGIGPLATDDPRTPTVLGDRTAVVVGGGARLVATKEAVLVDDVGGDGRFDVGDTLGYRIVVSNAGDSVATGAQLADVLPPTLAYLAGSLTLDGAPLTDAADGDEGAVSAGRVDVQLGSLLAGATRILELRAHIVAGPYVANQAELGAAGGRWLSDGDPGTPGAQPALTVVDPSAPLLTVALAVSDVDGGELLPNDAVRFVLDLHNAGSAPIAAVQARIEPPAAVATTALQGTGRAQLVGATPPTWSIANLAAGERVELSYVGSVNADVPLGEVLTSQAGVVADGVDFDSEPVSLVVGGGAGTAMIRGHAFRDGSLHDGVWGDDDQPIAGYNVALVPTSGDAQPSGQLSALRSVRTQADGSYQLTGVPPGSYRLRLVSEGGTVFLESGIIDVKAGQRYDEDLAVDPSGVIYRVVDGQAASVTGAQVFLVDGATGEDLPAAALLFGQQGQVTGSDGFYRFDVQSSALPGSFYIRLVPPSPTLVFPSQVRPPVGGSASLPLGSPATPPPDGRISQADAPDISGDTTYFLRFDLDVDTPNITNNHIPLDALSELIRITKVANRKSASLGQILTYTVTLDNPTERAITLAEGGVTLRDDVPSGLRWVEGSGVRSVSERGSASTPAPLSARHPQGAPRVVSFGPFDLPAFSSTTIRYYAVVGVQAQRVQKNRARLYFGATPISEEASASVRIEVDPIFDEGTVLGRVYCEGDDGHPVDGKQGLAGARVYLDTGYYVDTDIAGKFHFRGVPPGRHLIKLDLNTTPPGSTPTTDIARDFYLSRGLLAKIDFGVTCNLEEVQPVLAKDGAAQPQSTAQVVVDPSLPAISLDGAAQPLPWVDAVLVQGDDPQAHSVEVVDDKHELTWQLTLPAGLAVSQWQISVFGERAGKEVWRVGGSGTPPARLPWTLANAPLMPNEGYLYRLAVVTPAGDLGEGIWRRLVLRAGTGGEDGKLEKLALWRGDLFEGQSEQPSAELGKKLSDLVGTLREQLWPSVRIRVHTYDSERRSTNLILSQRRAVAIRNLLTAAGVPEESITAVGRGDVEPIMPPSTKRARALNSRVEVDKRAPPQPVREALGYPGWIIVGNRRMPFGQDKAAVEVPIDKGDTLDVDVREPGGRRVHIVRSYPFATAHAAGGRSASVSVSGSLAEGRLALGGVLVPLPLLRAGCGLLAEPRFDGSGLVTPLRFGVSAGAPLGHWAVRIMNPGGSVLAELGGDGDPPAEISWEGRSASGVSLVRSGSYSFRCMLEDREGNRFVSASMPFELGTSVAPPLYDNTLRGDAYPQGGAIAGAARAALEEAARLSSSRPGARVVVQVHDSAVGGKVSAQIRTARLAVAIKQLLVTLGVAESAVDVSALGATHPLMPGDSGRAGALNQRVVVRVVAPAAVASESIQPHLKVGGQAIEVGSHGEVSGAVTAREDARLSVDMQLQDGRALVAQVPLFDFKPRSVVSPPTGGPPTEEPLLGSRPQTNELAGEGASQHDRDAFFAQAAQPSFADSLAGVGVDAVAGGSLAPLTPRLLAPSGEPRLQSASGGAPLQAPSGAPRVYFAPSGPPVLLPPSGPPVQAAVKQTAAEVGAPAREGGGGKQEAAEEGNALQLSVWLPAEGAQLSGERLTVRGRTHPKNSVRINGEAVITDPEGRFAHTVVLPVGRAKLDIECEDGSGQVAHILRTYSVPKGEWFLLALGDGVVGVGPQLDGQTSETTAKLGGDAYLHGRAIGYFKGRLLGSALWKDNPFQTLRLTAHVDTGKKQSPVLLRELIDPERFYPVYGDAAEEVQDVSSREKVYLSLEADRSRLLLGNFQASLKGLELFRYQRTLFGGALDVEHSFVAGQRTEVHAFVAGGEGGVAPRRLAFAGTGGSLYFLKDTNIVEGSERVELVVRDSVTGAPLLSLPEVRDADYRIDYHDGRLTFMQPIPSTVASGWQLGQNPTRLLEGNPIFVEVSYEYDKSQQRATHGEESLALQVRHTFGERLTLGAGVVDEDRRDAGGGRYRLVGGEARLAIKGRSHLALEVAHSQRKDADHLASYDGGLTFAPLGSRERFVDAARQAGRGAKGWAAKVQLAGDVTDFLAGHKPVAALAGGAKGQKPREVLPYVLYAEHQDPGFYSAAGVFGQGQSKVGGQLRALLSKRDTLWLRHDGVWSRLFVGDEKRLLNRQLSVVGYQRSEAKWKAGLDLGHNYKKADGGQGESVGLASLYGERQLLPRLWGLVKQEMVAGGGKDVASSLADRFASSVGARYQLDEALWLSATETLRWSGSNSTQVGIKADLDDDLSLYVSERLTASSTRSVSTTVAGAQSSAIPGSRSYAEYQLDALAAGKTGRAVFGVNNRWQLVSGLDLSLSYERAQLVGRYGAPNSPTGSVINNPEVTGFGSGALSGNQQFSASSYTSAGIFPVGISSRDAFAIGLDYLVASTLKAGTRFELRYDRADARLGGQDRLVFYGMAGGDWRLHRDLVVLARSQGASVENVDESFLEGQFLDISVGVALRPARHDRYSGLAKWTRRYERRALGEGRTQYQLEVADVLSIEPAVELGLGFQLVGKLALKADEVVDARLPRRRSTTLLALGRLNYHLTKVFDVAAEYRWLGNMLVEQAQQGALFELAWIPVRYLSVGVGYNFSRFSDDLLQPAGKNDHGLFLRVTGHY